MLLLLIFLPCYLYLMPASTFLLIIHLLISLYLLICISLHVVPRPHRPPHPAPYTLNMITDDWTRLDYSDRNRKTRFVTGGKGSEAVAITLDSRTVAVTASY